MTVISGWNLPDKKVNNLQTNGPTHGQPHTRTGQTHLHHHTHPATRAWSLQPPVSINVKMKNKSPEKFAQANEQSLPAVTEHCPHWATGLLRQFTRASVTATVRPAQATVSARRASAVVSVPGGGYAQSDRQLIFNAQSTMTVISGRRTKWLPQGTPLFFHWTCVAGFFLPGQCNPKNHYFIFNFKTKALPTPPQEKQPSNKPQKPQPNCSQ